MRKHPGCPFFARQLKLRATHSETSLRRLHPQSAQADFALCCPQFQLLG